MIGSFWLSENERGRIPCSCTKKSGFGKTSQRKAVREEFHFIRFLGFQLAAVWQGVVCLLLCLVVPVPEFSVEFRIITSLRTELVLVMHMKRRGPSLSLTQINGRSLLVCQAQIESQLKKGA